MQRLLVMSILLASTPALAGDLPSTEVSATELPAKAKPRGSLIKRVLKFTDKNGTNYIAFSTTSSEKKAPDGARFQTRWLYIDHWAIAQGKAPRELLPARDFVQDCPLDMTANFVDDAFHLTDLDNDGIAEVTYGYQLACRGDVSPAAYKLLLVENGTKHILRGEAKYEISGLDPMGGTFTPEPEEKKWPAKFYAHAVALWKTTSRDGLSQ
ncbi:MAG: hypothetical protein SFX73_03965 [Kofleriaceae bacterium]|nr:hypothetical protein [Kofleriaceae bacterium]